MSTKLSTLLVGSNILNKTYVLLLQERLWLRMTSSTKQNFFLTSTSSSGMQPNSCVGLESSRPGFTFASFFRNISAAWPRKGRVRSLVELEWRKRSQKLHILGPNSTRTSVSDRWPIQSNQAQDSVGNQNATPRNGLLPPTLFLGPLGGLPYFFIIKDW